MIEAGDGPAGLRPVGEGPAVDAPTEPVAAGLVAAVVAGFSGAADVADGPVVVGAVGAVGVVGGTMLALGVGKPAFARVMVALPSGCPMKGGITKVWAEAS